MNDNHHHTYERDPETGELFTQCGCENEKRVVLVSVKTLENEVDLFDKFGRENDSK